jgi:hypothetical protein
MSSTTSQKFRDFTGEPLKDKPVSDVPGLGPKLASNLEGSGITKVCDQLIFFLQIFDWRIFRLMNY